LLLALEIIAGIAHLPTYETEGYNGSIWTPTDPGNQPSFFGLCR
jgi:hypothetical protein